MISNKPKAELKLAFFTAHPMSRLDESPLIAIAARGVNHA
jgi:hypothetical protein